MCKFEIKVTLCKCRDPACKQRNPEIADDQLPENEGGHAVRVTQYYRISSICPGWFVNKRSDRLMLQYKLPEWNANGQQDCLLKELVHHKEIAREGRMCKACRNGCVQPPPETETKKKTQEERLNEEVVDLTMRGRLAETLEATNAEGSTEDVPENWPLETHLESHRSRDN